MVDGSLLRVEGVAKDRAKPWAAIRSGEPQDATFQVLFLAFSGGRSRTQPIGSTSAAGFDFCNIQSVAVSVHPAFAASTHCQNSSGFAHAAAGSFGLIDPLLERHFPTPHVIGCCIHSK